MKIDELADLMGITRKEAEYILQTHDTIELDLTKSNGIRMKSTVFKYDK